MMSVDALLNSTAEPDTDAYRAAKRPRLATPPFSSSSGSNKTVPDFVPRYTITAFKKSISSVTFSPDGKWLAVASAEPTIHVHETDTYALERTYTSHTAGVSHLAFSADSCMLASASDDRTVRIWQLDAIQQPEHEGPGPHESSARLLRGHLSAVFCVAWHPLGLLCASGGMDETVRVWDVQTGKCMRVLPAHSDPVSAVEFNQDGTTIVSCSWDGHIRMWDTSTGQCLKTLVDDNNTPISFVRFSPNSRYLFVSVIAREASIRLWDYQHDVVVKTYSGHVNRKYCMPMCLTPDGNFVVSGSEDNFVYIWDVQTMQVVKRFLSHKDAVLAIACHPKKRILATASLEKEPVVKIYVDKSAE